MLQAQLAYSLHYPVVRAVGSSSGEAHPHSLYNSFAVRGELTRTVQFAGRSTGQGDSNALTTLSPCALDHRLLERQSSARSTKPADNGFRSTEHVHLPGRSVQDVINTILAASLFPGY